MYANSLHGNRGIHQLVSEWIPEVRSGNPYGARQGFTEVGSRTASFYLRSSEQRSRCALACGGSGGKES
jgi:hypothetical protein